MSLPGWPESSSCADCTALGAVVGGGAEVVAAGGAASALSTTKAHPGIPPVFAKQDNRNNEESEQQADGQPQCNRPRRLQLRAEKEEIEAEAGIGRVGLQ